ncbi:hypothetical protein [Actinoallomurus sp. CA-150999]|uniref:hypothetical protein n=1 Tax=Actinoallomurus sp. CA-150999 TaxID=3239887 RepID=UPI003D8F9D3D
MKTRSLPTGRAAVTSSAIIGVALAGILATGSTAVAQPVSTAGTPVAASAGGPAYTPANAGRPIHVLKYKHIKTLGKQCGKKVIAEARGRGPITLTLMQSRTVSNTYSSTFGVDVDGLSAAVGFDVTKSRTITVSGSYVVPRHKYGTLKAHPLYKRKSFKIYNKITGAYYGHGTAYQVVGDCFTHTAK